GIDIRKEAENAISVCRARGECVDMRQVVAGAQASRATAFFQWSIAGIVELPFSGIRRKELVEEFRGVLRIAAHDGAQPLDVRAGRVFNSGDAINGGPISNIFVKCGIRLLTGEKKFYIVTGKVERSAREIENVACFEFGTEDAAVLWAGVFFHVDEAAHAVSRMVCYGWR